MDLLSAMEVFVRVVEDESFSAAAQRLGLSRAAVSKRVRQLEDHLGVALLNRTTRSVGLTEIGETYYERCRRVLAEVEHAHLTASRLHGEPRGRLKLSAPLSFAILHLGSALAEYCAEYPGIEVDLTLEDKLTDVPDQSFDLAIRIARLADSTMIARKIATTRPVLCAAPDYLAVHRTPVAPAELVRHRFLAYSLRAGGNVWRFAQGAREQSVRLKPALRANNGDVLRTAALEGLGVTALPSFLVASDIRAGALRPLLTDWRLPSLAVVAVYPPTRRPSLKVRSFIDFLRARFMPPPPWHLPGIDDE